MKVVPLALALAGAYYLTRRYKQGAMGDPSARSGGTAFGAGNPTSTARSNGAANGLDDGPVSGGLLGSIDGGSAMDTKSTDGLVGGAMGGGVGLDSVGVPSSGNGYADSAAVTPSNLAQQQSQGKPVESLSGGLRR